MLRLLRVEAIKLRNDKAMRWAVIGFLGAPLMVAFMFLFGRGDLVKRGAWTAAFFVNQAQTMLGLLLGPMMLAVMGAQLMTIEYKQKTLKGLLPLPASLPGIFAVKAVLGSAALGLSLLLTASATLLAPALLGLQPSGALIGAVLRNAAILWAVFPAFLFFAMATALIAKNFVMPLAASAVALVAGVLAMQGGKGQYLWTAIPMMLLSGKDKLECLGTRMLTSLAYACFFLLVGLVWAKLAKRPE